jgi:hypothetical protein
MIPVVDLDERRAFLLNVCKLLICPCDLGRDGREGTKRAADVTASAVNRFGDREDCAHFELTARPAPISPSLQQYNEHGCQQNL